MSRPIEYNPDEILTNPGDHLVEPPAAELTAPRTLVVETPTTLKVRKCRLVVVAGPGAGAELSSEKERIRVGTHLSNDLALEDRTVSRHHFEIVYTDKGYLLVDLASTNGTFVDGQRVERAYLPSGAAIRVGGTTLSFAHVNEEISVEPDRDAQLGGMVGSSVKMRQVFGLIKKIAPMDVPVIIQGETGTGKELAARAIHDLSPRRTGPFLVLDCGAIPANLIESEFFGHEKGSFTGATSMRPGAFERANGGTIFLDELGELQLELQPKLLRVLENGEVRRIGSNDLVHVDVRVIAATNRDLVKEVQEGNFREDLYFRLSVINLQMPPLRQRGEDIAHLVRYHLNSPEIVARYGRKRFSTEAMDRMMAYAWPGNVRELINVISHVLTFAEGDVIEVANLPPRLLGEEKKSPLPFNEHLSFKEAKDQVLAQFEREYLGSLLVRCGGNVSQAARQSGMHRKSIERLAKKYQLDVRALRLREQS
jgi:DNA-binding NtrC family response regulator